MDRIHSTWFVGILALGMLSIGGCGGGTSKYGVSGMIKFKNQPLAQGVVQFHAESKDSKTPFASATIESGKYSVPAESGLEPGTYRVTISSAQAPKLKPGEQVGGVGDAPAKELIPSAFNEFSKITTVIEAKSDNQFNQDIP